MIPFSSFAFQFRHKTNNEFNDIVNINSATSIASLKHLNWISSRWTQRVRVCECVCVFAREDDRSWNQWESIEVNSGRGFPFFRTLWKMCTRFHNANESKYKEKRANNVYVSKTAPNPFLFCWILSKKYANLINYISVRFYGEYWTIEQKPLWKWYQIKKNFNAMKSTIN